MATTFQDPAVTFLGDVTVSGTLTASGVPSLNGTTLLVNGDAVAGTDQDAAVALLGGSGSTNLERMTLIQDSSAGKMSLKRQSGAAGTTEASPTLHLGVIGTTASVNSTLVLEAGASSTNKPASLVNTGSSGVLAITGTTGVTLSDSVGTLSLTGGAVTLSGNLALGGNKVTGAGAATTNGDLTRYEQVVRKAEFTAANQVLVSSASATYAPVSVVTTSAGAGDVGKLVQLDASGKFDSSVIPSTSGTTPATIMYNAAASRGSTNTNVLIFPTNVAARTQGTGITYVNSASLGTYFQVATAGVYDVIVSFSPAVGGGWCVIKAAAAVTNNLNFADTDIIGNGYSEAAGHPVTVAAKAYLSANDRIWVAAERNPDGSAYVNAITVVGPVH